jgi:cytochrome c oxidase subunit 2
MKPPLQSVLNPGGPDAQLLSQLSWVLIIGACVVFVTVMALLAYALRHSRRERRSPPHDDRVARRWLLIGGAGLPAVLLLTLLVFAIWRTGQLTATSSLQPLRIAVTAHMWWWEVRYYDTGSGREAVVANELHIPTGVPVYLALTSADVIHAYWLPSLAGKVDMVPGRLHGLTLRADHPGLYRGQCAEYCGIQHARMALHLTAQEPQAFADWLSRQAAPIASGPATQRNAAPAAAAGLAATPAPTVSAASTDAQHGRGRKMFVSARCTSCHSVRGLEEQPAQGAPKAPDLTHIGSRLTLAAGTLPMHRGPLAAWIADPQALKPGARMPSASIDASSVNDIAAWLESLK